MEEIARFVGLAVMTAILINWLRSATQTALAGQLAAGFVVLTLLILMAPLREAISVFLELGRRADIKPAYTAVVLKAVGTAYIAAFGAQLAKDAKEESIAMAVEMVGKVIILLLCVPIVAGIMDALVGLL